MTQLIWARNEAANEMLYKETLVDFSVLILSLAAVGSLCFIQN
jgi:hypothetical protein